MCASSKIQKTLSMLTNLYYTMPRFYDPVEQDLKNKRPRGLFIVPYNSQPLLKLTINNGRLKFISIVTCLHKKKKYLGCKSECGLIPLTYSVE